MKLNSLQFGKAMSAALFVLLLSVAGMKNALAQQGALNGVFTINSSGDKVRFSKGNLRYDGSTNRWRFAEEQWDVVGSSQNNSNQNTLRDLFGWGTSGWDNGNQFFLPWNTDDNSGSLYGPIGNYNLTGAYANSDWGVYNAIINGGNAVELWYTLSIQEWQYILESRSSSYLNGISDARFAKAIVNGVKGIILFPDVYIHPVGITIPVNINSNGSAFTSNVFQGGDWDSMELAGCVFLPTAGKRNGTSVGYVGVSGLYWSNSSANTHNAKYLHFNNTSLGVNYNYKSDGYSVRLVCDVYTVNVSPNPNLGGSASGGGTYAQGQSCTVQATPNTGYTFVNWTQNGISVSNNANYTFYVTSNRTLVANFEGNSYIVTATANPTVGGTISGAGSYIHGLSCTLTATANTGYTFVKWTKNGTQVSTNSTYTFTVTESASYVAHFNQNSYTIITTANPTSGGTATGGGIYSHGASCTLTATPATGYTFTNWTKNGTVVSTNANYTFTVTESASYVAHFNQNSYIITASANPTSGGTATGGGTYNHGASCTLTATANTGYTFVNWTKGGQEVSTNTVYDFTVTEPVNFVANFQQTNYDVSATANPAEGGTITGTGNYTHGQTCNLTATANEGYIFTNWTKDGEIVSTEPVYNFTVTESATFVANFEEIQVIYYNISANSNPSTGGSVTGAGTYISGQSCTLMAIPNEGYTFGSWTENGEAVSTSATYSFTVSGDRALVANFAPEGNYWTPENTSSYSLTMALTSIIQLDGIEQYSDQLEVGVFCGDECRGSQIASEFFLTNRYLVMLSIAGEIGDVLTFKLYDHGLAQELNLTSPEPVTFNADGYGTPIEPYALNFISAFEITATVDPEGAGTITGTGSYNGGATCTLVAEANAGFQFENWTLDNIVVSTNATYEFTVTQESSYVAHFQYVQTQALSSGWNWYSTYINQDGINGLTMLENSLGSNGVRIQSKSNGYVDQFEYNGTSYWYGTLNAITNEQMYMVRTNMTCNATMTGTLDLFSQHPVTINNGWNWIGFPSNESVSVSTALSGFTPEANDQIKSKNNGYSTYIVYGNNALWYGTLNTLEPGQGYMYKSNSNASKTLIYQNGRGETLFDNVTVDGNAFLPKDADYAYNMTITAVVELDGVELRSEDYELAAFVGNECRGSVKLMYVEPLDRYMAFLLVSGDSKGSLRFVLTDGNNTSWSEDHLMYNNDETVGTPAEPAVLHFGPMGMDENGQVKVQVYPNPSNDVFNIEGEGIRKIEVINAYGQVICTKEVKSNFVQIDLGHRAGGVYLIRVVTDKGITTQQIIKK